MKTTLDLPVDLLAEAMRITGANTTLTLIIIVALEALSLKFLWAGVSLSYPIQKCAVNELP